MPERHETPELDSQTLADLSALADGSLDPARVPAVRERVARSAELTRRYERERRAVEALRAVRSDRAPATLRVAVDARRRPTPRPRRRPIYVGSLATAVAAAVAALVLLLPGGTLVGPSVSQAADLALRGAAMAAPQVDRAHTGARLRQDVDEVYFPNWSALGWRATGQRVDRLGHRLAVTVYYQQDSRRIAYTILAAPALRRPGTATRWVDRTEFQSLQSGARLIVTWRRAGHTCILSGAGVSVGELASLASWRA